MSHITEIKLVIRHVDDLRAAVAAIPELEFREKGTYAWWGTYVGDSASYGDLDRTAFGQCAFAIGRKGHAPRMGGGGEWEIGVVKAKDGDGYVLALDTYGSAGRAIMEAAGGPTLGRLRQEYAAAVVTRKAKATLARKGFTLKRERLADGRIALRMQAR